MRYGQILLERNILNVKNIDLWVKNLAARAQNPGVKQWVQTMLPAYLKKTYDKLQKVQPAQLPLYFPKGKIPDWATKGAEQGDLYIVQLDDELQEQVSQVIDYLESEVTNHNLARIPFEVAAQRSKEWHQRLATSADTSTGPTQAKLVKAYPDGYKWVLLTTQACLDHEGNVMGNCVGGGAYDAGIAAGTMQIYSLRDRANDSHVTMAIQNGAFREVKGKQNKVPIAKYRPYVIDLLNALHISEQNFSFDLKSMGIFHGSGGFGSLFDVAEGHYPLPSGHTVVMLNADNYYVTQKDEILAHVELNYMAGEDTFSADNQQVVGVSRPDNVAAKTVRADLTYLISTFLNDGLTIDDSAEHTLYMQYGIVLDKKNGNKLGDITADMKLVDRDLMLKAYIGKDDFVLVDEAGDPLVFMVVKKRQGDGHDFYRESSAILHPGWEKVIPFFLRAIVKANVNLGTSTVKELKRQNWFWIGFTDEKHKWQNGADVIKRLKPIHTWEDSDVAWYVVDNWLWLWHQNRVHAALRYDGEKAGSYLVIGIDDAYAFHTTDISNFIIDLFEQNVAELEINYDSEPFLIRYNVYSDGNDFEAIDWSTEVNVRDDTENIRGDTVKTQLYKDTLENAMASVGYILRRTKNDDDYSENLFYRIVVINRAEFEHEQSIEGNTVVDHYDDGEGYMREHNLKRLPKVIKIMTYVWL